MLSFAELFEGDGENVPSWVFHLCLLRQDFCQFTILPWGRTSILWRRWEDCGIFNFSYLYNINMPCFCLNYYRTVLPKVFGNIWHGEIFVVSDWNELFTTKCVSCGFPIEAGDRWVEALNNNYHSQCFNCTVSIKSDINTMMTRVVCRFKFKRDAIIIRRGTAGSRVSLLRQHHLWLWQTLSEYK